MSEPTVVHSTFVMEKHFAKPPERVFAAFSDPAERRRWFGRDATTFEMDFRPGGRQRYVSTMGDNTPFPGAQLSNEGCYQDIVENRRVVEATTMAMNGRVFSSSLITFELVPTASGTDLICTHQGAFFEHSDGPQMRKDGWAQILASLDAAMAGP